jgi:putative CRISPR-associated protein (TIGR02620 family)
MKGGVLMQTIVVTRHASLVEYLKKIGLITDQAEVISQASAKDVAGKHVIGVLPIHLAALTARYTNVAILVPPELRGVELTLEQVEAMATKPVVYRVEVID